MTVLWGKFSPSDAPGTDRKWLSLVDHSADVSAVFAAMLSVPLVVRRLERLANSEGWPELWTERLAAHVALHDFGKANRGFQARRDPAKPLIGHVGPGLALLYSNGQLAEHLCKVLPFEAMASWGSNETFETAVRAVAAHHGRPLSRSAIENQWSNELRTLWAPGADCDPIAALKPLGGAVQQWFPAAFASGGSPLPSSPPFWHAVAGFVMLADWIGSDTRSFPLEQMHDRMDWSRKKAPQTLVEYGFDPAANRAALLKGAPIRFASISEHEPRDIQTAVGEAEGQIVVLEAETGSGKTEAALWRFARLFEAGEVDGLYFALPTRVAARSLYCRVCEAVARMFPVEQRPAVILAVPGYARVDGISGKPMPGSEVLWDDDPDGGAKRARWAAEHPKRFLAGTIAVGTIDQALLGAIRVKHAHMRSSALLRHLLVVDEVHASDVYMERLLTSLLAQHTEAGGHSLLLSATLGSSARSRLLGRQGDNPIGLDEAIALPYPAVSTSISSTPRKHASASHEKLVHVELDTRIGDPEGIARLALDAAERNAKVLVVRNLHRTAVATAEALHRLAPNHPTVFRCREVPTLHHGRFASEDRELLDAEIEKQMNTRRASGGLILIGTQTLEQSLDICADLLITDLCPADVLLQRIGRLHRHPHYPRPFGYEQARCILLCPRDLTPLLGRGDFGLGGAHGPYRDLVVLEATRRMAVEHATWRIPSMNRQLVERSMHPEALDTLTVSLAAADPRWQKCRQDIDGNELADAQIAAYAKLPWSKSFSSDDLAYHGQGTSTDDTRFGTRLGAQDLIVTLPDGVDGPFGTPIRSISIPSFWIGFILLGQDISPQNVSVHRDELRFAVQQEQFTYGRPDYPGVSAPLLIAAMDR
jgi:CRISPR-associated endonuclease/helicase Cas3